MPVEFAGTTQTPYFSLINQEWRVIEIPTLMIWGEKDIAFSKELTFGMEAYVKDFRIRYIPDCSHWVQEEQPQLVNQYMQEFLQLSFVE